MKMRREKKQNKNGYYQLKESNNRDCIYTGKHVFYLPYFFSLTDFELNIIIL